MTSLADGLPLHPHTIPALAGFASNHDTTGQTMMTTQEETQAKVDGLLSQAGVECSFQHMPSWGVADGDMLGPKWQVTFTPKADPTKSESFTYSDSLASIPGYCEWSRKRKTVDAVIITTRILRAATLYGKQLKDPTRLTSWLSDDLGAPLTPPLSADVLYCLISDASARDQTFAEWCSDFGCSEDSIKALETYRACVDNALRITRVIGREALEKLQEVLQDY